MISDALRRLAEAAGLDTHFRDVFGSDHQVSAETQRAILAAIDLPAATDAEAEASLDALHRPGALPPLVTAGLDAELVLPGMGEIRYRIALEEGGVLEGTTRAAPGGAALTTPDQPGYHRLELGGQETVLAVAPPRCHSVQEAAATSGGRPWGLAVQLYSLRRRNDGGLGDFGALREFVGAAGRKGIAAVAISPVHAQFSADPDRFSPYAPSSRTMLNVLHAEYEFGGASEAARLEAAPLVDWPAAGRLRLARLAARYAALDGSGRTELQAYRREAGEALERHARFEALHAHFFGNDPSLWHWRNWPEPFQDCASPEVEAFARAHPDAVGLHAYGQMLAGQGLGAAQKAARAAGMPIGLIADLAVGVDSGGSQCWANREATLEGLTIGAPPDLLSREGQSWGLVAFSPTGLRRTGFAAYIEMLRAAFRHAGGVRIDHAMGMNRLWVIPHGMSSAQGGYLRMPEQDLLRLVSLESHRSGGVVLAEDLGTVPPGFPQRLQARGVSGMRVLWFERDETGFFSPGIWTRDAAAMTSTHDLPTLAGWWRGRDIDWRAKLGFLGEREPEERVTRDHEREMLWSAMQASGAADGEVPPQGEHDRFVNAALVHTAGSACDLALLPLEDVLAAEEQPNLPGTLHEHPNWQRRISGDAATLLDPVSERLDMIAKARGAAP